MQFESRCPTNFSFWPELDKLKLVGHQTAPPPGWRRAIARSCRASIQLLASAGEAAVPRLRTRPVSATDCHNSKRKRDHLLWSQLRLSPFSRSRCRRFASLLLHLAPSRREVIYLPTRRVRCIRACAKLLSESPSRPRVPCRLLVATDAATRCNETTGPVASE